MNLGLFKVVVCLEHEPSFRKPF